MVVLVVMIFVVSVAMVVGANFDRSERGRLKPVRVGGDASDAAKRQMPRIAREQQQLRDIPTGHLDGDEKLESKWLRTMNVCNPKIRTCTSEGVSIFPPSGHFAMVILMTVLACHRAAVQRLLLARAWSSICLPMDHFTMVLTKSTY